MLSGTHSRWRCPSSPAFFPGPQCVPGADPVCFHQHFPSQPVFFLWTSGKHLLRDNYFQRNSPQVLFYYRLPEEEQELQKNPMCWAFPRLGEEILRNMNFQHLKFIFQPPATTGDGVQEECRRILMPSVFSPSIWSTTRWSMSISWSRFVQLIARCSWSYGGGSSWSPSLALSGSYTGGKNKHRWKVWA